MLDYADYGFRDIANYLSGRSYTRELELELLYGTADYESIPREPRIFLKKLNFGLDRLLRTSSMIQMMTLQPDPPTSIVIADRPPKVILPAIYCTIAAEVCMGRRVQVTIHEPASPQQAILNLERGFFIEHQDNKLNGFMSFCGQVRARIVGQNMAFTVIFGRLAIQ